MKDSNCEHIPTKEEIKKMSYIELWGIRRKNGMFYYVFYLSFLVFFLMCFIQILVIFDKKENLNFVFHPWFIPVALLAGFGYWEIHEKLYIKKILEPRIKKEDEENAKKQNANNN